MSDLAGAVGNGLRARIPSLRLLVTTSGSLIGSMVVTSGLGAAFWWIAAQLFTPSAVGVAAGAISLMLLLGSTAVAGAGTLLVRELARHPGQQGNLVSTAVIIAGSAGAIAGGVAAIVAPAINPDLQPLAASPAAVALVAIGVSLTAVGNVVDLALLGLLRAGMQLVRNIVFAVGKLVLLVPIGWWVVTNDDPLLLYAVWSTGALVSFAVIAVIVRRQGTSLRPVFAFGLVRTLARSAASHQLLNLALQLPTLGLPVLVALIGTPILTAQFFLAWMLASLAFYVPLALSQTLYAVGANSPTRVWEHARVTVSLAVVTSLVAVGGLSLLAAPVLRLFGPTYEDAAGIVPLLAAAALPLALKDHYHVVYRIRGRAGQAGLACALGATAELLAAGIGFSIAGLTGLAVGWLVVLLLEATFMGPAMVRAARESAADRVAWT